MQQGVKCGCFAGPVKLSNMRRWGVEKGTAPARRIVDAFAGDKRLILTDQVQVDSLHVNGTLWLRTNGGWRGGEECDLRAIVRADRSESGKV